MELKTRRVNLLCCTVHLDEPWMKQVARNLKNFEGGFRNGKRYLLMDRDAKFCELLRNLLDDEGIESVRLHAKSPNLNAHQERFMRSIKSECLTRMIFFGENMLRNAVHEYRSHYHQERNHQGLESKIIDPGKEVGHIAGNIECREPLGGMLPYYYREVA